VDTVEKWRARCEAICVSHENFLALLNQPTPFALPNKAAPPPLTTPVVAELAEPAPSSPPSSLKKDSTWQGTLPDSDTPLDFVEEIISGKGAGNCGFNALEITRKDAVDTLLVLKENPDTRRALATEIVDAFLTNEPVPYQGWEDLFRRYEAIQKKGEDDTVARQALLDFCAQPEVFEYYVRCFSGNAWLGYQSALLIAQAYGIQLYIWKPSADQHLTLAVHTNVQHPKRVCHLFHTNNFTHFNRLSVVTKPTLVQSPPSPRSSLAENPYSIYRQSKAPAASPALSAAGALPPPNPS
jgi:hypothetical protein